MTLKSRISSCIQFKSNNISSQLPGIKKAQTTRLKAVPVEHKKPIVKVSHSDANDNEVMKVKRMEAFLQQFKCPPPNMLVTRPLESEKNYDQNAWNEDHWKETRRYLSFPFISESRHFVKYTKMVQ